MNLSPIVLFVYNRPIHTRRTVEALQKNDLAAKSVLIIFSDGPKQDNDKLKVEEVREYIKTISGFKSVEAHESEFNYGLSASIIAGVTETVNKYGQVIVLEDDLETSPGFLKYMNESLEIYKQDINVASIHGYCYPIKKLPDLFFLKGADCWGWATWKDRWRLFEKDSRKLLKIINERGLLRRFDFENSGVYVKMLQDNIDGKNDSWAVRWYATALIQDKYTLYPGRSLVNNIGCDNTGTHCGTASGYWHSSLAEDIQSKRVTVEENEFAYKAFCRFIKKGKAFSRFRSGIKSKIKPVLNNLLPPFVLKIKRLITNKRNINYYNGNYSSWEAALKNSSGYDSSLILEKVKNATLKVKYGEALYERDSVLFHVENYNWPLLAILLKIAGENKGRLNVIDFGGSLGSTYYQNRKMLSSIEYQWCIVEQKHFVDFGKSELEKDNLHFYYDINSCLRERKPDIIILSSVLPYLKEPYNIIKAIKDTKVKNILIDRTPFLENNCRDRLTVQYVPECIYKASYPARFFCKGNILKAFSPEYKLILEFDAIGGTINLKKPDSTAIDKGLFLERIITK